MPTAKSAPSTSRRDPVSAPKSNLRRRQSVSFESPVAGVQNQGELEDEDEDAGENMVDMLSILKEYRKKKSSKSSSKLAAIEAKKKIINDASCVQIKQMKEQGAAYIEQVKAKIDELKEQEVPPEAAFTEVAALSESRSKGVDSLLHLLVQLLSDLSPARAEVIEENSTDLHSHKARFEKTGKKIMKKARKDLQSGMEQQKLAADSQAYIKHFKYLVQK